MYFVLFDGFSIEAIRHAANIPFFINISRTRVFARFGSLKYLDSLPTNVTGKPTEPLVRRLMNSFSATLDRRREVYQYWEYFNPYSLPVQLLKDLLVISTQRFSQLPNVIQLNRSKNADGTYAGNLTVVGDVHGQYDDFAQIFSIEQLGGMPNADNQFVFNGDIVDRGPMAIEILIVLLVSKLLSDDSVHILRGNHESEYCTGYYGFEKEVKVKYGDDGSGVYAQFLSMFKALPVAAVVENEIFVTHGGLGGESLANHSTIAKINAGERNDEDSFQDLVWSDPVDKDPEDKYGVRPPFGPSTTKQFLRDNNLAQLIRSHEMREEGYSVHHDNTCWTVFSAPNYCGQCGNLGAVIRYTDPASNRARVVQFDAAPKGVVGKPRLMPTSPLQLPQKKRKKNE